jgi:hypothetical protein
MSRFSFEGLPRGAADKPEAPRLLFGFEDDTLELVPFAARRALDAAGIKLSLKTWQAIPLEIRRQLVRVGAEPRLVASEQVQDLLAPLRLPRGEREAWVEPATLPSEVLEAMERLNLPAVLWTDMSGLERYVLAKLASGSRDLQSRSARLAQALREIAVNRRLPEE